MKTIKSLIIVSLAILLLGLSSTINTTYGQSKKKKESIMSHVSVVKFRGNEFNYNFGIMLDNYYGSLQVAPQGIGLYTGAQMLQVNSNIDMGFFPVVGFQYNKNNFRFDSGFKFYFAPIKDTQAKGLKWGVITGLTFETMEIGFVMSINR